MGWPGCTRLPPPRSQEIQPSSPRAQGPLCAALPTEMAGEHFGQKCFLGSHSTVHYLPAPCPFPSLGHSLLLLNPGIPGLYCLQTFPCLPKSPKLALSMPGQMPPAYLPWLGDPISPASWSALCIHWPLGLTGSRQPLQRPPDWSWTLFAPLPMLHSQNFLELFGNGLQGFILSFKAVSYYLAQLQVAFKAPHLRLTCPSHTW